MRRWRINGSVRRRIRLGVLSTDELSIRGVSILSVTRLRRFVVFVGLARRNVERISKSIHRSNAPSRTRRSAIVVASTWRAFVASIMRIGGRNGRAEASIEIRDQCGRRRGRRTRNDDLLVTVINAAFQRRFDSQFAVLEIRDDARQVDGVRQGNLSSELLRDALLRRIGRRRFARSPVNHQISSLDEHFQLVGVITVTIDSILEFAAAARVALAHGAFLSHELRSARRRSQHSFDVRRPNEISRRTRTAALLTRNFDHQAIGVAFDVRLQPVDVGVRWNAERLNGSVIFARGRATSRPTRRDEVNGPVDSCRWNNRTSPRRTATRRPDASCWTGTREIAIPSLDADWNSHHRNPNNDDSSVENEFLGICLEEKQMVKNRSHPTEKRDYESARRGKRNANSTKYLISHLYIASMLLKND